MTPTICLNMIVRNESKVITRVLNSVANVIDTYCIVDTGSKDDTKQIITNFFEKKGIEGKLIEEPFRDFGYNRTHAFNVAKGMADYALFLDADMELTFNGVFDKNYLIMDAYTIRQGSEGYSYSNVRLVRLSLSVECKGPTHEFYNIPPHSEDELRCAFIKDHGDGGCKTDKFERDVKLLKQGLIHEPNNERYYFYLANSYFDLGRNEEAIEMYKKRIEMGGWYEEVFYSLYRLGICYRNINEPDEAIRWWLASYYFRPQRSEGLYEITKYYRETSQHALAYHFYRTAKNIPLPKEDQLFIHNDVYDHQLDYEYSVIAYYLMDTFKVDTTQLCKTITKLLNYHDINHILSNYRFYTMIKSPKIIVRFDFKYSREINGVKYNFVNSTPSLVPYKNGYLVNIRMVNYRITENGTYLDCKQITSENIPIELSPDGHINKIHKIIVPEHTDDRYLGIEDVKLIEFNREIKYIGTCFSDNKLTLSAGKYDMENGKLEWNPLESPTGNNCEKNWALFNWKGELCFVYKWNPFIVGHIEDGKVTRVSESHKNPPRFFTDLRGSTNGYTFGNEVWFITHLVLHPEPNEPRQYFNLIVVVDKDTLDIKRYSVPFKFECNPIEYTCGLVVSDTELIVGYSTWDRTSTIASLSKRDIVWC